METERILLRHWQESDAEALFKSASDPNVGPRAGSQHGRLCCRRVARLLAASAILHRERLWRNAVSLTLEY